MKRAAKRPELIQLVDIGNSSATGVKTKLKKHFSRPQLKLTATPIPSP
jgi:hypothetical protein